jgi:transposase-like protein
VGGHLVRMWLADAGIPTRPAGGRRGVTRPAPRNRKPVPPADELRELLLVQRLGRRELAARYQVHPSTMSRWLTEAGLPTRLPPAGALNDAEIVALYLREAIPAAEVARRAGASDTAVLRALRSAGIPVDRSRQVAEVRMAAARRSAEPPLTAADGDLAEARYRDDGWSYRRIGEALGVHTGRVRRELARRQVPPRPRPVPGRASRQEAPVAEVRRLYVDSEWTADDVGAILDLPGRIVLRTGHAHGLPIRQGGRPSVSATVELIDGLYADEEIAAVLDRQQVPRRPAGGGIAERFPEPVPLTPELLADLYTAAGCSSPQIEVLTGQPQIIVRNRMQLWGIPFREEHLPPALLRLRAAARARFLAGVLASYREHGSTTKVAAEYGCAPDTIRRWITAAGGQVPGRGRWPRRPAESPPAHSPPGRD